MQVGGVSEAIEALYLRTLTEATYNSENSAEGSDCHQAQPLAKQDAARSMI